MSFMKLLFACFFLAIFVFHALAAEVGTLKGVVTDNGVPVKATIHLLQDGYSGTPQTFETVSGVIVTRHFLFGAAVTFPLASTGVHEVETSKKGAYSHSGLPAGTYRVGVTVKGRLKAEATGVAINPGATTRLDFDIPRNFTNVAQ